MTVMRVERVVYGVPNLDECVRFFGDFGLDRLPGDGPGAVFAHPDRPGPRAPAGRRPGPAPGPRRRARACVKWSGAWTPAEALDELAARLATDREVRTADGEVHTVDETGFGVGLAVGPGARPRTADYPGANRSGAVTRWNQPLRPPGRVRPLRLCHVALNIPKAGRAEAAAFYTGRLGFRAHRPGPRHGRVPARPRRPGPAHVPAVPPPGPGRGEPHRLGGGQRRRGHRRGQPT